MGVHVIGAQPLGRAEPSTIGKRPRPRPLARAAETRSKRAVVRQALGSLKSLRVRAHTRKRYAEAYARFSRHVQTFALSLASYFALDAAMCHYVEHLWHEGEPKLWMTDALAALHFYLPSCKRQMPVSWSLHKAWGRSEMPSRACPITLPILHGICGLLITWGFWRDALLALCAFDLVLRTGEMLELRGQDIEHTLGKAGLIVRLRGTKVGQRRGQDEGVVTDDPLIRAALRLLAQGLEPGDLLLQAQAHHWRHRWNAAIRALKLQRLDIRAYSLRRGGATWLFRKSGSFDRCLDRGRWGNSRNARQYIEDAAAMAASLCLNDTEDALLDCFAQCLFHWLRQSVDESAVRDSDHFSSAATSTRQLTTLPTPLEGPAAATLKKRPAAYKAPPSPQALKASHERVLRGLERFAAKRTA